MSSAPTKKARRLLRQPHSIGVRVTVGFLIVMSVLLLASSILIYQRMQSALDHSIRDIPRTQVSEINVHQRHRKEALDELLVQLSLAYALTLAVSGFVGYRTTRAALDPVDHMQRQASEMPASERHALLLVPEGNDELTRLATTLNDLLIRTRAGLETERRFIGDASHELLTPLSLMTLQIDLALKRERTPAELTAALTELQRDTRRLVKLTNDLLLIARADADSFDLELARINIREAATEAAARFELRAAQLGRAITVTLADDLTVIADAGRLQQVFTNLLENALAYGAGDVTISAAEDGLGHVAVGVSDHGVGFPSAFTERAFDRFATASVGRSGGGTGLGLSIVRAIAEAHGGEARIVRQPGSDETRVEVVLPASTHGR